MSERFCKAALVPADVVKRVKQFIAGVLSDEIHM
jgi:hypothetical protein